MKSVKNLFIAAGMIMIAATAMGQTKVINLWNGKVPGSIAKPSYKQIVDSLYYIKLRYITNPSLQVYPAPASNNTGTAVVVCPGGGYYGVSFINEGIEVAQWLNGLGISAFVLHYRLPDDAIMANKSIAPLQDSQQAIRVVRSMAKKYGIDPNKIGIMGFSAGGHMAATLSTRFDEKVYKTKPAVSARPNFSLLIYPVITMDSAFTHHGSRDNLLGKTPSAEMVNQFSNELQITENTPPTFMVHSMDDKVVSVKNSVVYIQALKRNNVPCELHIYQSGGHGYGLAKWHKGTESTWTKACENWLITNGFGQNNN